MEPAAATRFVFSASTQTISAYDSVTPTISGASNPIVVSPGAATKFAPPGSQTLSAADTTTTSIGGRPVGPIDQQEFGVQSSEFGVESQRPAAQTASLALAPLAFSWQTASPPLMRDLAAQQQQQPEARANGLDDMEYLANQPVQKSVLQNPTPDWPPGDTTD